MRNEDESIYSGEGRMVTCTYASFCLLGSDGRRQVSDTLS